MNLNSKNTSLILLGLTAIVFSRLMFVFFNDPEGPNLLIVGGFAAIVYLISLAGYFFIPLVTNSKKLWIAIVIQVLVVAGMCFFLR